MGGGGCFISIEENKPVANLRSPRPPFYVLRRKQADRAVVVMGQVRKALAGVGCS